MKIERCVQKAMQKLQGPCENPRLEAEVILSTMLSVNRAWIRVHALDELPWITHFVFRKLIRKRASGLPIAYIFGRTEWAGLEILVNKHTLIPRDETEVLVGKVVENLKKGDKVLDLGTGSGCIGVYLGKAVDIDLTALDISARALDMARRNFAKYRIEVDLRLSDMLSAIPTGEFYNHIVANLPYVPESVIVTQEVQKEPSSAIFSSSDGLDHYRRLVTELKCKNIKFENLWIEFLPTQKVHIAQVFKDFEVVFLEDIGGDIYFARIK